VGKGNKVRIGVDVWPVSGLNHIFMEECIQILNDNDIHYLNQVSAQERTNFWGQGWMNATQVGLYILFNEAWDHFIESLQRAHIRLSNMEDELVWKLAPSGNYSPKLGYSQLIIGFKQQEPSWWWKGIQKVKCPLKEKIFMWCLIKKRFPTWDRMKICKVEGPG
jgi:hypothetical protein